MRRQFTLITLVLASALALRILRMPLVGTVSTVLTVWPSQVIFGFYFAILTLAIQGLQRLGEEPTANLQRQALLFYMLIGICLDLVLVNVQEITQHIDASYGPVVIWDVATFFAWLRVVDLCQSKNDTKFSISWTVRTAPLFGLGREILFLPYKSADADLAYLDLLFGHLLIGLWVFLPLFHHWQSRERNRNAAMRIITLIIFIGCTYWLVSALENIIGLVWAPFYPELYHLLQRMSIPIPVINCFQFVVAVVIMVSVRSAPSC